VSGLFIAFYLDEDVSVLVADLVRARGFDVVTTYEAGRAGRSDADQLNYATSQDRVILTHNRRDFEALARDYALAGREHAGMILAVRRSPYEITERLLRILNQVTADEMAGQIRYV
jgi:predicted nuclease of predicted toxin-antitoxin system